MYIYIKWFYISLIKVSLFLNFKKHFHKSRSEGGKDPRKFSRLAPSGPLETRFHGQENSRKIK